MLVQIEVHGEIDVITTIQLILFVKKQPLEFTEMVHIQHTKTLLQMRNKLTLLLIFIFQLTFSQISCVSKKYTFDNFIDAFINVNNDENFKPELSIMHISSFYYTDKGYMITITRDNIESTMVNQKSPNLEYFKYNGFDLLLQGKTLKDITFLKKIIKKKTTSNLSKIKFKEPYENISNDPYQWFLLFDKKMNLINYTLPESKEKIIGLFEDFNIKINVNNIQ
jgi:hypothetical protein